MIDSAATPLMAAPRTRIGAELAALARFARRPTRGRPSRLPARAWAGSLIPLVLLTVLFAFLVSAPTQLLLNWLVGIAPNNPPVGKLSYWAVAVLAAPLIEETMFRAGLRNARYTLFAFPVLYPLGTGAWQVSASLALLIAVIAVIDHLRLRRLNAETLAALRFTRGRAFIAHYPRIVWMVTFAFAWSHTILFNVPAGSMLAAALVLLAPVAQLGAGLVMAYTRLRYGLWNAMLFHGLYNCAALALARALG